MQFTDSIRYLKGVGEQRSALYAKLGVYTLGDLLHHYPRAYLDLGHPVPVEEAALGQMCTVRARVVQIKGEQRIRGGLSLFKFTVVDEAGSVLLLTFFNARYTAQSLKLEQSYLFYGRMGGTLLRREMNSPQVFPLDSGKELVPIYPLTAGLTSKMIARHVAGVLPLAQQAEDPLPPGLRRRQKLCTLPYALSAIHRPTDPAAAEIARRRLIFDELFSLSLGMALLAQGKRQATAFPLSPVSLEPFLRALPFQLTQAQRRAIDDAMGDLCRPFPMNRLIQGDVGSGKTMVAAACAYAVAQNHRQAAMMAPTELLADQHFHTLAPLLEPLGVRVGLLTGSTPPAQKRALKEALAAGEVDLLIGTHALLTKDVAFSALSLVVTDEQHRFGVEQRAALAQKGDSVHLLVMSATPIPRTLALIIYGDLDLSVIDQLPPGRTPVGTYRIDSSKRERAYGFIRRHLEEGRQAYIVCPLVEAGEDTAQELTGATQLADRLRRGPFRGFQVELLHGRMKPSEKERVMSRFARGEIQLLVSTTVVEVGVDVPNAVIMMVENAERFGLSQLHQLRGRVGRGNYPSHCILLSDATNETTLARLNVLCRTTDGFVIAEEDLRLRGPGDFFGSRQHGLPQLKLADLVTDPALLAAAREEARALLEEDPQLAGHPALMGQVQRLFAGSGTLN
ncbi:MAG TPA: ATP-dependent DNA helicase RecG [Firmicutes bacterium]|nr:ATP-dependent DNA helicase RecG [Bacillota bacterium]